ncbi:MAG UNVERIFIED_CONTAM: hypothetical protein LVR18_03040 [Planctomycetaceae bacterium]|jgi:hypothetical protein
MLSVQGLSAKLGNFATITGNAAIQKDLAELQAIITNATATTNSGTATAGVSASAAAWRLMPPEVVSFMPTAASS